ncbi:hypothetical protein BDP27DRAFT_1446299 [Rhodocollybia butyracea]|uniref:Uncharacterized protein n=1 Tax=Rhodocollybia butyracea TaxID=206335 RepID=A0A9P5PZZ5_9AGAR|nr:hypothetical protein BDP27DRAFT_1446299 [Rhodocollybia butyracea]
MLLASSMLAVCIPMPPERSNKRLRADTDTNVPPKKKAKNSGYKPGGHKTSGPGGSRPKNSKPLERTVTFIKERESEIDGSKKPVFPKEYKDKALATAIDNAIGSFVPTCYNFKGSWAPSYFRLGKYKVSMVYFIVTEDSDKGRTTWFGWAADGPTFQRDRIRDSYGSMYAAVTSGDPAQGEFKALVEPPSVNNGIEKLERKAWGDRLRIFNINFMKIGPAAPVEPLERPQLVGGIRTVHFIKDRRGTTTGSETRDTEFLPNHEFTYRGLTDAINVAMGSRVTTIYKGALAPLDEEDMYMVYFKVTEEGREPCYGWAAKGTKWIWHGKRIKKEGVKIYATVSFSDLAREFKPHVKPLNSAADDPTSRMRKVWEKALGLFNKNFNSPPPGTAERPSTSSSSSSTFSESGERSASPDRSFWESLGDLPEHDKSNSPWILDAFPDTDGSLGTLEQG